MKTVYEFYMECDLIPLSARVNIYQKNVCVRRNWQDIDDDNDTYDDYIVKSYKWNPKTNLLRIYV